MFVMAFLLFIAKAPAQASHLHSLLKEAASGARGPGSDQGLLHGAQSMMACGRWQLNPVLVSPALSPSPGRSGRR